MEQPCLPFFIIIVIATVVVSSSQQGSLRDITDPCPHLLIPTEESHRVYEATLENFLPPHPSRPPQVLPAVNETQLKEVCKRFADYSICRAEERQRRAPQPLRSALDPVLQTTYSLRSVCDRPDLFDKSQLLINCVQSANRVYEQAGGYNGPKQAELGACSFHMDPGTETALSPTMYGTGYAGDFRNYGDEAAVQKGVCCQLKALSTCVPSLSIVREGCSSESIALVNTIFDTALAKYNCTMPLTANCPNQQRQ